MKIGLLTDGKMANLALMKISYYHKARGDEVDWFRPVLDQDIDRLYISKIFDYSKIPESNFYDGKIIWGGTGTDLKKCLPPEIEKYELDYSIYPDIKYSLVMFSRGCPRKCPFCVVPEKEGFIRPVEVNELNPAGEWIEVLDNNFFASPMWRDSVELLTLLKQPINITQGIDIRILTPEQARVLSELRHAGYLHFAWDNPKENISEGLNYLTEYFYPRRLICYVLIGYNTTHEENYYRVMKLKEWGVNPFVMPYNKKDPYQKRFARWVNRKAIFKSVEWKDYNR